MNDEEYITRILGMERKMYRIAHSILWNDADCADAIQETVVKGWLKKTTLREAAYFDTWMVRILINECRNLLRREKAKLLPLEECVSASNAGDLAENLHLREMLKKLPEKYRLVLLLHHMEGYSLEEIAEMLRCPCSTVKSRLHRARKSLQALMDEEGENEHEGA